MSAALRDIIARNRAGETVAMPSICTAHPQALLASLLLARQHNQPVLIEATSNQANQYGGYTGMQPADFRRMVLALCAEAGTDPGLITFGGDHLGPQVWRKQEPASAMVEAERLVAAYVAAGFTKIHLDCSEGCAGEPAQLDDERAAARAALLAAVCERAAPDPETLVYVIGTEVPPPGGGRGNDHAILPTSPDAARATLACHIKAFARAGLHHAATRIVGLVVQPGVDFEPMHVHHLPAGGATALRAALDDRPGLCFEAHSTDYQHPEAYPALARAGFAIHKVGPALTFAYRRALYALTDAADAAHGPEPGLRAVMEGLMLDDPRWWQGHYHGTPAAQELMRHFSYSDRIRYYWPQAAALDAVKATFARVAAKPIPEAVLLQYFSAPVMRQAEHLSSAYGITERARALVLAEVQQALMPYFFSAQGDVHVPV